MKAGWEAANIGAYCRFENGDRGKNYPGRKAFVPEGVPFVNAGHLGDGLLDLSEMNYIPRRHFEQLGSGKIRRGDLLFCLRGSLGKYAVVDNLDEGAIASSLVIVRPSDSLAPEYLGYYFGSPLCAGEIAKYANGAAQPNLSAKSLAAFEIPLPPLEEQQRIVAILEEAFEGLARARAHAEANLQNARELFDELVDVHFQNAQTAAAQTTLGALAEFRNGLNYTRSSKGRSIRIVGVGDFKNHFTVPAETLSEITIDGDLAIEDQLRAGDLLAVRSNGNRELIGRTMLVPNLSEDTSFSGFTIRIRLKTDDLLPEYLCEFMRTKAARRMLIDGGGGANISNLNQRLLSGLPIAYPGISEQRLILANLDGIRRVAADLVRKYRSKLNDLNELRQSLLQKAFSGELI